MVPRPLANHNNMTTQSYITPIDIFSLPTRLFVPWPRPGTHTSSTQRIRKPSGPGGNTLPPVSTQMSNLARLTLLDSETPRRTAFNRESCWTRLIGRPDPSSWGRVHSRRIGHRSGQPDPARQLGDPLHGNPMSSMERPMPQKPAPPSWSLFKGPTPMKD